MTEKEKAIQLITMTTHDNFSRLSGCDRAIVTKFVSGSYVSSNTEAKILRTARELAALQQKFAPVPLDLNSAIIRILLEKMEGSMAFSLMTSVVPTNYLVTAGKVTPYLLQSSSFSLQVAEVLADDLREQFPAIMVVDNAYSTAPEHGWVSDPRQTEEYQQVMK